MSRSKLSRHVRTRRRRGPTRPSRFAEAHPSVEALEPRLLLSSAPVFATPLEDSYAFGGESGMSIKLDLLDADGDVLDVTAVSDNAGITPIVTAGNRFARLSFAYGDGEAIGEIVVQLFEDLSPTATERFITLSSYHVNGDGTLDSDADPYYTDVPVHRIIDDFMFQTGDAENGDGTGGSPLGEFDDQFSDELDFSERGMLAMANSGPDTNDSQFFITDAPTPWLEGAHMIFGRVVAGWDTYEQIITADTDDNDRPTTDIDFVSSEVFETDQDATIRFMPTEGFIGQAEVTITVDDGQGNQTVQTVTIDYAGPAIHVADATDPLEDGSADHPYDSIQEAIDASPTGGKIIIGAGTYTEDLVIDVDDLEIVSADGPDVTIVEGVATLPVANAPTVAPNVDLRADRVSIHGLTFASPNVAAGFYASGLVVGGADVELFDNVFTSSGDGQAVAIQTRKGDSGGFDSDVAGLSIHDNTFSGAPGEGYTGVHVYPPSTGDGDVLIEDNEFSGNIADGIVTEWSNVEINDNVLATDFSHVGRGIAVVNADGLDQQDVVIYGNTIGGAGDADGFDIALQIGQTGQSVDAVEITANTFGVNRLQLRDAADVVDVEAVLDENTFEASVVIDRPGNSLLPAIWTSIGDALAEAEPNDTIQVGAGAYADDLNVALDDLTFDAAGNPRLTGRHTITGDDVSFSGFTFAPDADGYVFVLDSAGGPIDGFEVADSAFDFSDSEGIAIWLGGPAASGAISDVLISDNEFEGPDSRIFNPFKIGGSFGADDVLDVAIDGVEFTGNTVSAGSIPIHLRNRDVTGVVIDSSEFTDTDGVVYVWTQTDAPTGVLSGFEFTGNTVDDTNTYGVGIDVFAKYDDANFGDGNLVQSNAFGVLAGGYGFGAVSVLSTLNTYELDATRNFWGEATGPTHAANPTGTGSEISDVVTFVPWYATETVASNGQENVELLRGGETTAWSDTVQGAIDGATDGDRVIVGDGTYEEDLAIAVDNLELTSRNGADVTTIEGVATESQDEWPFPTPNIDIRADGVSIHDLTIVSPDVEDGDYSSGIVLAGRDIEIYDNTFVARGQGEGIPTDDGRNILILTYRDDEPGYATDVSGLSVHDNFFSGSPDGGYVGVWVRHSDGDGAVVIRDNTFTEGVDTGILAERSKVQILDNLVDSSRDAAATGIRVTDPSGGDQSDVILTGNRVTGFEVGMLFGSAEGQTLSQIDATGNRIFANRTGIQVLSSAGGVDAVANDIFSNTLFGVENADEQTLEATGSWWGHKKGPTHPDNRRGKGDAIAGNVNFAPWADEPLNPEADLFAEIETRKLPDMIKPGDRAKLRFKIDNLGDADVKDEMTVKVYLSEDDAYDGGDQLVGTFDGKIKVKGGKGKTWRAKMFVDQDWTPGDYYIIAVLDTGDDIAEMREHNNEIVTPQAVNVSWAFGDTDNTFITLPRTLKLTDDAGTQVKMKIFGSGIGRVTPNDEGQWNITLQGTNADTKVKVVTRKGRNAEINNISAFGTMDSFVAEDIDLTGSATFYGGLGRLFLNDVDAGHTIDIRRGGPEGGVKLYLGDVVDTAIESDVTIRQLEVESWIVSAEADDGDNTITAPNIRHIWSEGDFQAVVGESDERVELMETEIGGNLANTNWYLTGRVDSLVAGGMVNATVFVDIQAGLLAIPSETSHFVAQSAIEWLEVGAMDNSNVAAYRLGGASLAGVETDNNGDALGLAARVLGDIEWRRDGQTYHWPDDWPADAGDFVVREVV